MISIIVVYNESLILRENLLQSLKKQDTKFELILVDNTKNAFKCYPKAQNYGGSQAHGEYLMFVHQDVELDGNNWLRRAEQFLATLNDAGVAGVSGIDQKGNTVGFINDRGRLWGSPIKSPRSVMTLDEQLVIVPSEVYNKLRFDEGFKWHSWAVDYCLQVQAIGLKVYVLPLFVSHNSSSLPIMEAGSLERDDLRLWMKHRMTIYKSTGLVSERSHLRHKIVTLRQRIIKKLLTHPYRDMVIFKRGKMLDIVVPAEQPYLKDSKPKGTHSVGLSNKIQYLLASKKIYTHDDYVLASLESIPFKEDSFDTINVSCVLEYMLKHEGEELLKKLERIGDKMVVKLPNSGLPIGPGSGYKTYKSIWYPEDLKEIGYRIQGYGIYLSFLAKLSQLPPFLKRIFPRYQLVVIGVKE